jgi:Domain of unknown function (DUF222)
MNDAGSDEGQLISEGPATLGENPDSAAGTGSSQVAESDSADRPEAGVVLVPVTPPETAAAAGLSASRSSTPPVGGSPVGGSPVSALGTQQGRFTHLNVTIAASTLAGFDDRPGDLDGHGPIPADLARAIALSASTVAAVVLKPGCGTALDLGRTTYRPRLAQRDHVVIRDQTCRFPGCRRAARRCQIDHSDEYCPGGDDGGVTCPCNLQCLCAFHHGLKTGGLWDSVQHPDASVTWTSPTGRNYTTQPRQWPTDDDDREINRRPRSAAAEGISARLGPSDIQSRIDTIGENQPFDENPPF